MTEFKTSRRIVFQGLGALGVAAALAGCGSDTGSEGGAAAEPGAALAAASEVPVGGGIVLEGVVLTQPTAGEFRAFTTACTHQGTRVDAVTEDGIRCPLHGSLFSIEDGAPTQGPATVALSEVAIKEQDGQIVAA